MSRILFNAQFGFSLTVLAVMFSSAIFRSPKRRRELHGEARVIAWANRAESSRGGHERLFVVELGSTLYAEANSIQCLFAALNDFLSSKIGGANYI